MFNIIAASFFQSKSCVLPGIGKLLLVTHSAETDFQHKQIKAPIQRIIFTHSADEKLFNEFSAISELMKQKLDEEGLVEVAGIGVFTKSGTGDINFTAIQLDEHIQLPVSAARVIRERSEHAMLVGDKETTNTEMKELLNEEEPVKDNWWVWAVVLGAAGILTLAFYLYQNGINAFANAAP